MGYFDYEKARKVYSTEETMLTILDALYSVDEYHLLRDSKVDVNSAFFRHIPENAAQYRKWLTICEGGRLFSTDLLSVSDFDDEMKLGFSTLKEINQKSIYAEFGLPTGYFVIAVLNYGAVVCLSYVDEKIYLWDTDNREFDTIWESFYDFLADEYNTAFDMIDDDILKPIPIKLLYGENE